MYVAVAISIRVRPTSIKLLVPPRPVRPMAKGLAFRILYSGATPPPPPTLATAGGMMVLLLPVYSIFQSPTVPLSPLLASMVIIHCPMGSSYVESVLVSIRV